MLVNFNQVLHKAQREQYAVGLFNALNTEMSRGVIGAAQALRSPVIVGTAEILLPFSPLECVCDALKYMAERTDVPVVLHYDHGLTFEKCMEALKLGFTSLMYDCSTDPYEENVRKLAELTKIAHAFGATVEAELGHVGDNDRMEEDPSAQDPSAFYTDPVQAKEFVDKTHVDALAIAVGTAHGAYRFTPKLDFDRIVAIRHAIPETPLVLHGGSGLSDEDFRQAIRCGIAKVNIFTDINVAGAKAIREAVQAEKCAMTDLMNLQVEAVKAETMKKMRLFGSEGKA
ncbi:MAG: class II fructose-bisphosphate aldolase [Clostridiales bacterium]|nr:class II fructose-bisphosphate aldolase [Clostridiales bacterium]